MRRVGFLVFEGITLLDFAGPAEVFGRAPGYEMLVFSPPGGTVTAGNGLPVAQTRPPVEIALDTLIVVGADDLPDRPVSPELVAAAGLLIRGAHCIASVCTGAFLLAELGLLDGRRATTHWRNAPDLARRHPQVHVEVDVLHVADGPVHTSAGITAGIDLALALVEEDHGPAVARAIAQDMIVFMHRPGGQSQFAAVEPPPVLTNPILRQVFHRVRRDPAGHTVASLAADANISARHLGRLFRAELGLTPARWLEKTRLSLAQRLLLDGRSVTSAALRSGFGSDDTLRRAFDRHLGVTPTEYRARFSSSRGAPT